MRLCAARRASLDGAPPGQAAGQHSARRRAPCRVPAAAPHIALRARAALPVHTTRCTAREFFSRAVHCARARFQLVGNSCPPGAVQGSKYF